MSGLLAGKVWQSDLASHLKPLAAALADIANDDGTSIYPSVAYMAWLLGKGRRSVQLGLSELRDAQIIEPVGHDKGGRGFPTEYRLIEANLPKRIPWKELRKGAENAPFSEIKDASGDAKGRISEHKKAHSTTERVKPVTPDPSVTVKEPLVEPSPHSRLMAFHFQHIAGPIPDPEAQGRAIKWLLATYKPESCEACYSALLKDSWRSRVSWLTVKSEIGAWLAKNGNGHRAESAPAAQENHPAEWYIRRFQAAIKLDPRYTPHFSWIADKQVKQEVLRWWMTGRTAEEINAASAAGR